MNTMHGLLLVVAACVTATSARAEGIVLVSPLIPYEKADTAAADVLNECDWNTTMPRYLAKNSEDRVKVIEQDFDVVSDKKLILVTTDLHTAGGGGWSGPKWLDLDGKLTEGGKLLGNFHARRMTIRGSMRGCGTLTSLSEDIAEDILEWLNTPSLDAKLGDAE